MKLPGYEAKRSSSSNDICNSLLCARPKHASSELAPDGGYLGGNTAEGQSALQSLTSGTYNSAVGFLSLLSITSGQLNTATGAGALLANMETKTRLWRRSAFKQQHWQQ